MTKATEKKVIKMIKQQLGKDYTKSDDLLITELVDWLKISDQAKEELSESVKNTGEMSWKALTTISMATKQILATVHKLGITPQLRNRGKKKEDKQVFNLNEFLN